MAQIRCFLLILLLAPLAASQELSEEERAAIDAARRAAFEGGEWSAGSVQYCSDDTGEGSERFTAASSKTVGFLEDLRDADPTVEVWIKNYLFDGSVPSLDEISSYGTDSVIYWAAPGAICVILCLILMLCCCASRMCPTHCCAPRHPLNEYTWCQKARPEICFFSCSALMLAAAVLGILSFAEVGQGVKKMGCTTEVLLNDSTNFVTELNGAFQGIADEGISVLDSVSITFSGGTDDIVQAKDNLLAEFQVYTDNGLNAGFEVNGELVYPMRTMDTAAMNDGLADGAGEAVDTLASFQNELDSSLVTPREAMHDLTVAAASATESALTAISGMRDGLVYSTIQVPEVAVFGGIFFSKESYNGLNEMLSDMESNSYHYGAVFFGLLIAALPFMLLGLLSMHFYLHTERCCTRCCCRCCHRFQGFVAVSTNRFGCLLLFMGMLLCFIFTTALLATSAVYTDVCVVLEDFGNHPEHYVGLLNSADVDEAGCTTDNYCDGHGTATWNGDAQSCACVCDQGFEGYRCHELLSSSGSGSANADATEQGGSARRRYLQELAGNTDPADAVKACFDGENLMDAMDLSANFDAILGDQLDFSAVEELDPSAEFDFSAYTTFQNEINALNAASFGWQQADFDKLDTTCTGGGGYVAALETQPSSQDGYAALYALSQMCDLNALTPGCDEQRRSMCVVRNTMAQVKTGCSDPSILNDELGCVGDWDHDADASTPVVARVFQAATITTTIAQLQGDMAAVDASYDSLLASVVDLSDSLKDVVQRVDPLVERIRGLSNVTYCDFIKVQYLQADEAICDLVLRGITNTAVCMWLAAFFAFFIVDALFFLEIRIGGVGQKKGNQAAADADGNDDEEEGGEEKVGRGGLARHDSVAEQQNVRGVEIEMRAEPVAIPAGGGVAESPAQGTVVDGFDVDKWNRARGLI